MTDTFNIHKDHLGKAQAAKHIMLINGIYKENKVASKLRHTIMPDGRIIIYSKSFILIR